MVTHMHSDLSTNFLSGSIPPSLGNLTSSLQYLRLSRNFLSGSIPLSMGNLTKLKHMDLGFNELTGQLPPQLGELKYLNHLDVGSNNLSGELPGNYANFSTWDQLRWFSVAGNRLTGQVPKFIANWNGLSYLSLSGNDFEGQLPLELLFNMPNLQYLFVSDVRSSAGFPFPKYANMTGIRYLVIRNCSISGEIPPYIGDWSRDLSFNNLTGGIPDSMEKLNLSKMFLTGNMLNGTVPSWVTDNIEDKADLSYNNFEIPRDGPKKGEGKLNMNSIHDSLYINCGGEGTVFDRKEFEADSATSNYYSAPRKNWAYSCSGDFGSKTYDSNFNIKEMASGTNKTWSKDFSAYVGDDHLLTIHFFRAGKGTFLEPRFFNSPAALSLNGPLKLESNYDKRQALIVLHVAMKCVNPSPTLRPKMSEVVSVLESEKSPQQISEGNATRSGLLTSHKSTVAEFLSKNYDWFFAEFNSKLLESTNYITRRQAVKLLGDILLDRSNAVVMTRYVSLESSHERAWLFIVIILHKL
ncbi:hypothetical protein NC653_035760 [Populus alba x Populus x berolinensis]|uniref:Non-specific serine/threonine protein kinase n=1 Tax=Populus alba x Populus x berolinensis TaxID=444605 RepID=A0AAD6LIE4_9ROSI|nr:hypothetical protein NC653_035760 [Populus alba x Populus x berolinensis]